MLQAINLVEVVFSIISLHSLAESTTSTYNEQIIPFKINLSQRSLDQVYTISRVCQPIAIN